VRKKKRELKGENGEKEEEVAEGKGHWREIAMAGLREGTLQQKKLCETNHHISTNPLSFFSFSFCFSSAPSPRGNQLQPSLTLFIHHFNQNLLNQFK